MSSAGKRLWMCFVVLASLYALGTAGYIVLGHRSAFESFYITTVILTTVGMKDSGDPLSLAEQLWTTILMVAGIGTVLYAMGNVVAFFVEGQLREVFGRRHQMHKINALTDHYIVVGFGRMGRALCTTLHYRHVPFVLLENDEGRVRESERLGYPFLNGDGMQEQTLSCVGIDRARGLATCLPHDADNVFVTLTARSLNENLTIIARSEEVSTEAKLIRAGANHVICPPLIGAVTVTSLLMNPTVDQTLELDGNWPDLELSRLSLHRLPGAVGKTVQELATSGADDVVVLSIVGADGTQRFNPPAQTQLDEGDEVVVVGRTGGIKDVIDCIQSPDSRRAAG